MDAGLKHEPTAQNRHDVKLLKSFGHNDEIIADHLDITLPTLKKYYRDDLKESKHFLELSAGGTCVENLRDENASVRQKAAEFILTRKCRWTEKSMNEELKDSLLDTIINNAAQQLLKKKEEENDY